MTRIEFIGTIAKTGDRRIVCIPKKWHDKLPPTTNQFIISVVWCPIQKMEKITDE
jgi:hypothetical protein